MASLSPSPIALNATTETVIAIAGNAGTHQAVESASLPSKTIAPQLGVGGCTPRPRNDRYDSSSITAPMFNVAATLLIYVPSPMRAIPLYLARSLGRMASRNRVLAGAYIMAVFFGLPLLLLFLMGTI